MVAGAFHYRMGTGVTHRKTFARRTGCKQLAAGSAVQAGVTDDGGFLGFEVAATGRLDHQLAAGHALAHVIVGIAFQNHVQAAHVPDPETLAGGAGEIQGDRRIGYALVAVPGGNFAGQAGTDGAVTVGDFVAPGTAGFFDNSGGGVLHHLLCQLALVEGPGALYLAYLWFVCRNVVVLQQAAEIELVLALGVTRQALQQVYPAHQLFQGAHTQPGQPLPGFFCDKAEEVHGHFHGTLEVLFPQVIVLGSNTGGAVVEVADTQVLAAQRHHRRGTKAEAFGPQNGGFHHIQTGLDTAIGLQADLATQVISTEGLLGFGQPQIPRGSCVTDGTERAGRSTSVVPGYL